MLLICDAKMEDLWGLEINPGFQFKPLSSLTTSVQCVPILRSAFRRQVYRESWIHLEGIRVVP